MGAEPVRWEAPGPGRWESALEEMPTPMCRLLCELLPCTAHGWSIGSRRYGLLPNDARVGSVNGWFFFTRGEPGPVDLEELERTAAETLATKRWRGDLRRWREEVRPSVVATSRELVRVDLGRLTDGELAQHVQQAIDHFTVAAPLQLASNERPAAVGALLLAARAWGVDPRALLEALAGSAPATSSAELVLDRIAAALRAAGRTDPPDLDSIRDVGGDAAAALDELLTDYGWRVFDIDLLGPTLAERPEAVLAAVRAALAGWGPRSRPDQRALAALRAAVPERHHGELDELAVDARAAYGVNDEGTVVLVSMPLGLVRRALLEVGRRLHDRGRVHAAADVFEAESGELAELLGGAGPSADELSDRTRFRAEMALVVPPRTLGDAPPPAPPVELPQHARRLAEIFAAFNRAATAPASDPRRARVSVGSEVVRGRAVVAVEPIDAVLRLAAGDVLVVVTTTAAYNTIFPMAAAVAVQEGHVMSHAAVLARELGLPAVIGVPDLLTRVADGDIVEVDPGAGTIRVVEPRAG